MSFVQKKSPAIESDKMITDAKMTMIPRLVSDISLILCVVSFSSIAKLMFMCVFSVPLIL